MFNRNNTYLIPPQVPSSLHPRFDVNGVEILLHHHHDVFAGHYLAGVNAPIIGASTLINQELHDEPTATLQSKQSTKKDRHSKIYTAQGPRDRRVRLSIGIARKFFDLQEMLGFDKPSKTLDWLFTKSKAAIKDLVHSKQKTSASVDDTSSSPSECELVSSGEDSRKKRSGKDKGARDTQPTPSASYLAKESRAKARARARERTREKMCNKQLNGARNNGCNGYNVSCSKGNSGFHEDMVHCSLPSEADLIQDSVANKRKTKSPLFFGFQQNGMVSSSSYIMPSANGTENNWDVGNFTSQSNLYAILDHHKFINSNSNI